MPPRNLIRLAFCLSSVVLLTGCASGHRTEQSHVCTFSNAKGAAKCHNGELAFFEPNEWGNDQMPLYAVSDFCNTNHQVIMNKSGVICTFRNRMKSPSK